MVGLSLKPDFSNDHLANFWRASYEVRFVSSYRKRFGEKNDGHRRSHFQITQGRFQTKMLRITIVTTCMTFFIILLVTTGLFILMSIEALVKVLMDAQIR